MYGLLHVIPSCTWLIQWLGLRTMSEPETIDFPMKIMGFSYKKTLKPIPMNPPIYLRCFPMHPNESPCIPVNPGYAADPLVS